jgi:hypothetical protein
MQVGSTWLAASNTASPVMGENSHRPLSPSFIFRFEPKLRSFREAVT